MLEEVWKRTKAALKPGEEVLVEVKKWDKSVLRFSRGDVHQSVADERLAASVVLLKDGKLARAEGVLGGADDVENVVSSARETLVCGGGTDFAELPDTTKIKGKWMNGETSAEDLGWLLRETVSSRDEFEIYGSISSASVERGVFGTNGTECAERLSLVKVAVVYSKNEVEIKKEWAHNSLSGLRESFPIAPPESVKFGKAENVPSHDLPVVLSARSFVSLLRFFLYLLDGGVVGRGESPYVSRLGERIFREGVDILAWTEPVSSFDADGLHKRKVELVADGVLKNFSATFRSRKQWNVKGRGASFQPLSDRGVVDMVEVRMPEGELPGEYVYVSDLHYLNLLSPEGVRVTGLTRYGTFLVKNGEVVGELGNLRIVCEVEKLLSRGLACGGREKHVLGFEPWIIPPVLTEDVRVIGDGGKVRHFQR